MDSRLKLTDEQNALVEQLRETIDKMWETKTEMLLNEDGFLLFYNGNQVDDIHWPENADEDNYKMQIGENLPCVELGAIKVNYCDEFMGVQFKE